tara:strand:- start:54 stop:395 length:342 start_codon:yes stop_codon:yes gene_type:complete
MAEFHRIITDTNTTLATSSQYTQYDANNRRVSNNVTISKIVLTAQRDVTVKIWLDHLTVTDGTKDYIIALYNQPKETSVVWDTPIKFDVSKYNLILTTSNMGSADGLYVTLYK